jgi:hypothetical protein
MSSPPTSPLLLLAILTFSAVAALTSVITLLIVYPRRSLARPNHASIPEPLLQSPSKPRTSETAIVTSTLPAREDKENEAFFDCSSPPKYAAPLATLSTRALSQTKTRRGRGTQRIADSITERFATMSGTLTDAHGFYTTEWTGEVEGPDLDTRAQNPTFNASVLLGRARAVYDLATATFPHVSGIYAGKSSRLRLSERFGMHRKKTAGKAACIVMVTIGSFAEGDVPASLKCFDVGGEVLALLYESLLTKAVRCAGLPEFIDDAVAGGGRMGSNEIGVVYVLLVVSNEPIM